MAGRRPARVPRPDQGERWNGLRAITGAGASVDAVTLSRLRLAELTSALAFRRPTARTAPFSSLYVGAVSVEAALAKGYVVGTGSTPVATTAPADVTLPLDDASRLIRSVDPRSTSSRGDADADGRRPDHGRILSLGE